MRKTAINGTEIQRAHARVISWELQAEIDRYVFADPALGFDEAKRDAFEARMQDDPRLALTVADEFAKLEMIASALNEAETVSQATPTSRISRNELNDSSDRGSWWITSWSSGSDPDGLSSGSRSSRDKTLSPTDRRSFRLRTIAGFAATIAASLLLMFCVWRTSDRRLAVGMAKAPSIKVDSNTLQNHNTTQVEKAKREVADLDAFATTWASLTTQVGSMETMEEAALENEITSAEEEGRWADVEQADDDWMMAAADFFRASDI